MQRGRYATRTLCSMDAVQHRRCAAWTLCNIDAWNTLHTAGVHARHSLRLGPVMLAATLAVLSVDGRSVAERPKAWLSTAWLSLSGSQQTAWHARFAACLTVVACTALCSLVSLSHPTAALSRLLGPLLLGSQQQATTTRRVSQAGAPGRRAASCVCVCRVRAALTHAARATRHLKDSCRGRLKDSCRGA
jgi:hypothetical protein